MQQGILFLIALGAVWIVFATIQDFRKREVANWLNFSLIAFALSARFFYSLFLENGFNFFYQGLFGLIIFIILGNVLYYSHVFAGGDAKLMIALGTVLPFSDSLLINIKIFVLFIGLFFIVGSVYGIAYSLVLMTCNFANFRKEFSKQLKLNKKIIRTFLIAGGLILVLGMVEKLLIYLGLLALIFPFLYVYAKSIEEGIMISKVKVSEITEGDWLYTDLRVGKKVIRAKWDGLSNEEIALIKRKFKKISIKKGIPFIPVFLISFCLLIGIYFSFPFENYGILLGSHIFPLGLSTFSIF